MTNHLAAQLRALLRGTGGADAASPAGRGMVALAIIAIGSAMMYGAIMGSYGLLNGGPAVQILYGAIKAPILLFVTFALTLPSFLVVNTLLGLRDDLPTVLHALFSAQAVVAIALLSLSPLTLFWYVSVTDYNLAILFNGLMFALASLGAQRPLRVRYAPLIRRNRRHGSMLKLWLVAYAFVGIQMGWVLRPFIGRLGMPAQFFRDEKWDNAYVIVAGMIWRALTH
ncbi:MAG: hypothetical protein H7144_08885 [Burkholderiales bacterium]|nr:hypothetical protein [Phycisphaerae bacterium]